jgi:two-component system cell cycle response regulator
MKILIVEDDPTNLKLINIILSSGGHKVFDSEKGSEALEIIKTEQPDLILVDLVLPDMNGVELARKLGEDISTAQIPIIAVTGYPERFKNSELIHAGFDAYLVKPINTRMLSEVAEGVYATKKKKEG